MESAIYVNVYIIDLTIDSLNLGALLVISIISFAKLEDNFPRENTLMYSGSIKILNNLRIISLSAYN